MFNKTPHHWAFYTRDLEGNYKLISDRVCTRPSKTKDCKAVSKLLHEKKADVAGYMLYENFKHNYQ